MGDSKERTKDLEKGIDKLSAGELHHQVQELRERITEKAHKIVHEVMPQKVVSLTDLYEKNVSFNVELGKIQSSVIIPRDSGPLDSQRGKKRKIEEGNSQEMEITTERSKPEEKIPSNKIIVDLLTILKREILDLIEMINTVKIWIQLNIPRIEDGNNFGVSIQEETVSELSRAEDSGFTLLESITKYFVTRAKLVSKILKHPNIEDYSQTVIELDEKEFINLRLCCLDLRNNYAILHDMIIKNMEKIKKPRSSNHMSSIF